MKNDENLSLFRVIEVVDCALVDGEIFFGNPQKKLARIVPFGGKIRCSMDEEIHQNGRWLAVIGDFGEIQETKKYSYGASVRSMRFLFYREILINEKKLRQRGL